jgi:VWFA-related protein
MSKTFSATTESRAFFLLPTIYCLLSAPSHAFFLLTTVYCLLSTPSAPSQTPIYKIEKDRVEKDGRQEDRIFVAQQRDRDGKPKMLVTLQFKILKGDGQPALDIAAEDIVVKEDGRRVTDLEIHRPTVSEALTTVLAIDISGSMKEHGKMAEAKQAARLFLDRLDNHAESGLILFDHKLRVQELPAAQQDRIRSLINAARPGGGTAYLDATAKAIEMLGGVKGRRAVVLMTDGVDLNSKARLRDVVAQARAADVAIYTIGVGEPGKNIPVTTVLVLDHSGSMRQPAEDQDNEMPKIKALHRAAARFIDIMRPGSRTTLLPFNDEVSVPKPFSADRESLKAEIRTLSPSGGTSLYDATYAAVQTLEAENVEGKKAVVVLTDGVDEEPGSRHRFEEVISRAQEAKIPLHMLGLGRPGEVNDEVMGKMARETGGTYHHARNDQALFEIFENLSIELHDDGIDEKSLTQLAEETGGKYFPARDISELRFIYQRLADDLQTSYTVTFPSLRQGYDGTSRDVSISVVQNGVQLSDVLRGGYNVSGVIVPEMSRTVYLTLLALLGGLLLLPAWLRHLTKENPSPNVQ